WFMVRGSGSQNVNHEPRTLEPEPLVDREAVEESRAAGADEVFLTAAATRVRGIPRAVAAALLVGVAELRRAHAVARPVVARVVHPVRVGAAVRLRPGEDVVLVRHVADAVDRPFLLGER